MFFKKKQKQSIKEECWVIPETMWDAVYFNLNMTYDKQCEMSHLYMHKSFDFRRNLNRKPTEKDYYNQIKDMLFYVGDGTVGDVYTKTIYTFVVDDKEYKISNEDKNLRCDELENGDLLITGTRTWKRKNKDYSETIKHRVDCGDWKRKNVSTFYKIDCKTIDSIIEDAKTLIDTYEKYVGENA